MSARRNPEPADRLTVCDACGGEGPFSDFDVPTMQCKRCARRREDVLGADDDEVTHGLTDRPEGEGNTTPGAPSDPEPSLSAGVLTVSTPDDLFGLRMVEVDGIDYGDETQSRAELDADTVEEYRVASIAGADFPPVVLFFDGAVYWVADGFHRIAATRKAELELVLADVRRGGRRDAILYAVSANQTHGLRRSNADKRRAVAMLLEDEEWSQWSNREIARRVGVSDPFVMKLRREMNGEADGPDFLDQHRVHREHDGEPGAGFQLDDPDADAEREERETGQVERDPAHDAPKPEKPKRDPLDRYYTPDQAACAIATWAKRALQLDVKRALCISVGKGAFVAGIDAAFHGSDGAVEIDRVDLDLDAAGLEVENGSDDRAYGGVSFLDWKPEEGRSYEIVIDNPPYNVDLCAWVEHALTIAPVVILLLRGGWETAMGRIDWLQGTREQDADAAVTYRPVYVADVLPRIQWEGKNENDATDTMNPVVIVWDHRKNTKWTTTRHDWIVWRRGKGAK